MNVINTSNEFKHAVLSPTIILISLILGLWLFIFILLVIPSIVVPFFIFPLAILIVFDFFTIKILISSWKSLINRKDIINYRSYYTPFSIYGLVVFSIGLYWILHFLSLWPFEEAHKAVRHYSDAMMLFHIAATFVSYGVVAVLLAFWEPKPKILLANSNHSGFSQKRVKYWRLAIFTIPVGLLLVGHYRIYYVKTHTPGALAARAFQENPFIQSLCEGNLNNAKMLLTDISVISDTRAFEYSLYYDSRCLSYAAHARGETVLLLDSEKALLMLDAILANERLHNVNSSEGCTNLQTLLVEDAYKYGRRNRAVYEVLSYFERKNIQFDCILNTNTVGQPYQRAWWWLFSDLMADSTYLQVEDLKRLQTLGIDLTQKTPDQLGLLDVVCCDAIRISGANLLYLLQQGVRPYKCDLSILIMKRRFGYKPEGDNTSATEWAQILEIAGEPTREQLINNNMNREFDIYNDGSKVFKKYVDYLYYRMYSPLSFFDTVGYFNTRYPEES